VTGADRARRSTRRIAERVIADGLVAAAVLAWWLVSLGEPDFVLPSPWAVAKTVGALFTTPSLLADTATSTARVLAAVALSMVVGGALAFIPWRWPVAEVIVQGKAESRPFSTRSRRSAGPSWR
jgi:ABC-type nitrate/sulfonate/bicarbonate transport system permease component